MFRQTGTILATCEKTNISREIVRQWRIKDEDFKAAFDAADLDVTELLEDSAMRDALGGDTTTRIFLLKARRPDKYRDTASVSFNGPVPLSLTLSDDRGTDAPPKK